MNVTIFNLNIVLVGFCLIQMPEEKIAEVKNVTCKMMGQ